MIPALVAEQAGGEGLSSTLWLLDCTAIRRLGSSAFLHHASQSGRLHSDQGSFLTRKELSHDGYKDGSLPN